MTVVTDSIRRPFLGYCLLGKQVQRPRLTARECLQSSLLRFRRRAKLSCKKGEFTCCFAIACRLQDLAGAVSVTAGPKVTGIRV